VATIASSGRIQFNLGNEYGDIPTRKTDLITIGHETSHSASHQQVARSVAPATVLGFSPVADCANKRTSL